MIINTIGVYRATFSGGYDGQSWRVVSRRLIPGRVAFHFAVSVGANSVAGTPALWFLT
jgi:hypothetical protein